MTVLQNRYLNHTGFGGEDTSQLEEACRQFQETGAFRCLFDSTRLANDPGGA